MPTSTVIRRLRFVFALSESFPPFRPDTVELFCNELVQNRGHEVIWLFDGSQPHRTGAPEWACGEAIVGKSNTETGLIGALRRQINALRADFKIFSLARRGQLDFIQVRDNFFGGLLGLIAARLNRTRFFFWLSFPYPEAYAVRASEHFSRFPFVDRIRARVTAFLLYSVISRFADHIFVQSDEMKRRMEKKGVPGTKMTPVPMGVATGKARELLVARGAPQPSNGIVAYLGTLSRDRRLEILLAAHKLVLAHRPGVTLRLVGCGETNEDEEFLLREAEKLGIAEFVSITGFLPRTVAWQRILEADVCVSPFVPDPVQSVSSPTKLIEYLALGRPVVANDHPEQKRVLADSGAGICVPWDERSFADAIYHLLDHRDKAEAMAKLGPPYVEQHRSYHAIAEMLESKYFSLCASGNSAHS